MTAKKDSLFQSIIAVKSNEKPTTEFVLELTAGSFLCRMVVAGHNMIRGIFADSANVFRYDAAYGLNQGQVQFLIPNA